MHTKANKNSKAKMVLVSAIVGAAAMTMLAAPSSATYKSTHYNKHSVTKKASFHTLKSHARSLRKSGIAKVDPIRRHGRLVGFKKTFKSGDRVIVKRGRHGRVTTTTLRKKNFYQRFKHRLSIRAKKLKHHVRRARHAWSGRSRWNH